MTGRGDPADLQSLSRTAGSGVVFIQPAQMVRYHIAMLMLDPLGTAIPCLVREQGDYVNSSAFAPNTSLTQVIAENVTGFKVYLSANSGADWAGMDLTATNDDTKLDGWTGTPAAGGVGGTSGVQTELDAQLLNVNRVDYTASAGNLNWYRDIPVLVRLDVTTRTATQRAEYSSTPNALAYKALTQTLVLIPRHFGLPMK